MSASREGIVAWDKKRRGPAEGYFYQSVRTLDGVKKVYMGRGAAGHEAAAAVALRRKKRLDSGETVRTETAATEDAERLADELEALVEVLSAAWLILSGHRHHRGEWRLRHDHREHEYYDTRQ